MKKKKFLQKIAALHLYCFTISVLGAFRRIDTDRPAAAVGGDSGGLW